MSGKWNIDDAKVKNEKIFSSHKLLLEETLADSSEKLDAAIKLYSGRSPNLDAAIKHYSECCSDTIIASLQKIYFCEEIEGIKVDINDILHTNPYSLSFDNVKVLASKCATANETRTIAHAALQAETYALAQLSIAFVSDAELRSLNYTGCDEIVYKEAVSLASAFAEDAKLRSLHYESCDEIFENSIVSSTIILDNHDVNTTKIRDNLNSRVKPTLCQSIFKCIGCDE